MPFYRPASEEASLGNRDNNERGGVNSVQHWKQADGGQMVKMYKIVAVMIDQVGITILRFMKSALVVGSGRLGSYGGGETSAAALFFLPVKEND